MKIRTCAGLISAAVLASPLSVQAAAQDYFWPAHQPSMTYKMKSHAMRGTVTLESGRELKIGDKSWRELNAQARRVQLKHLVEYQRADETGLYTRFSTEPSAPETLALKLPATAGTSWKTLDADGKPSLRTIEKIGQCEVRGKAFETCVTVGYEAEGLPAIAIYTPGYGEIVNSQVNGFVLRELTVK